MKQLLIIIQILLASVSFSMQTQKEDFVSLSENRVNDSLVLNEASLRSMFGNMPLARHRLEPNAERAGSGDEMREKKEQAIIRLLKTTPDSEVDKILNKILGEALYSPSKHSLLNLFTNGIHDKILFIGNDNYKEFILTLVNLSYKSTDFQSKLNPEKNDQYIFTHSYSSIYQRFWEFIAGTSEKPQREDISASITNNGKIDIKWKYIKGFSEQPAFDIDPNPFADPGTRLEPVWSTEETYSLDPFYPVIYLKNNDLGMLSDFNFTDQDGSILPVPAIVLLYASDKAGNQTAFDVAMLTADAVGLATGFGELAAGVNGLRKVWAVADMVNSGINLTANATGLANNESVQPYLTAYNLMSGLSVGGRIAASKIISAKSFNAFEVRSLANEINTTTFDISQVSAENIASYKKLLTRAQQEAKVRNLDNVTEATTRALAKLSEGLLSDIKLLLKNKGLTDTELLRLNGWTQEHLNTLNHYLSNTSKYGDLATELKNKKLFDAVESIIDNPENAWDIIRQTQNDDVINAVVERIGKSQFFTEVVGKGRIFEELVNNKIATIPPFSNLIQQGYTPLEQIHLLRTGSAERIIADNLFVKELVDDRNRTYFRAVISDSKLNAGTAWTKNQKSELIDIFKNDPNKKYIEFEVRSSDEFLGNLIQNQAFRDSKRIRIYREDVYKIISDGNNNIQIPALQVNATNFK